MASSKWNKCWLYDSAVKVPKTTRWRRKLECGSDVPEDANAADHDVQGEFSSFIEGLRNITSPCKKKKLLEDCPTDDNNEDHFTCNDGSQTTVPAHETPTANFKPTFNCHEYELIENHLKLVDCKGE